MRSQGTAPSSTGLWISRTPWRRTRGIEARIEKDVPLPPRGYGTASKYRPILDAMGVGDSIVMGKSEANALYQFALNKYTHYKITTRKVDDETRRIWRTK